MLPLDRVRAIVERHFRVYDAREERIQGEARAQMFFLMFSTPEFDRLYDAVRRELRQEVPEALVFLRREGGEDILFVTDRPPVPPTRLKVHVILLALTVLTTMSAGALFWHSYTGNSDGSPWAALVSPTALMWGFVTFALPLLLILGLHEAAHGAAARRHGLRHTLPYFIPVPPFILPIGTLGAFISLRDPMPDRKALFDVGASGPIAGFLVAIPVVILGAWLTGAVAAPLPDMDRPAWELDVPHEVVAETPGTLELRLLDATPGVAMLILTSPADDWRYEGQITLTLRDGSTVTDAMHGKLDEGEAAWRSITLPADVATVDLEVTWDDGLISFGDPLLVKGLEWAGMENGPYLSHPTFFAGWVGLLVTGINLLPVGQLDGGHVARAVFGDRMRFVALGAVFVLMGLVLFLQSWLLLALFVLLFGIQHPPPLNDRTPLDKKRVVMAALVLLVFVVTFVPQPIIP